jgi:hypothetical protein
LVIIQISKLEDFIVIIIGKIKAISTSKIKKIIAIKKNRIEKGIREEDRGLNPHSKGDNFSRSFFFFFANIEDIIITKKEINIMIILKIKILKIIYIKFFLNFVIGSYIYFLYYINLFNSLIYPPHQ